MGATLRRSSNVKDPWFFVRPAFDVKDDAVVDYIRVLYPVGMRAATMQHLVHVHGGESMGELPKPRVSVDDVQTVTMTAEMRDDAVPSDLLAQRHMFDPSLVVTGVRITVPTSIAWIVVHDVRRIQTRAGTVDIDVGLAELTVLGVSPLIAYTSSAGTVTTQLTCLKPRLLLSKQ